MPRPLTRLFDAALAAHGRGDLCPLCCGPRPDAPGVLLYEGDVPPSCAQCGRPVDPAGRSIVSPGHGRAPVLRVLDIGPRAEGEEDLASPFYLLEQNRTWLESGD